MATSREGRAFATNTNPLEIDLIVLATVTPDMFSRHRLPGAGAHRREEGLGLRPLAACSGFAYALTVGAQFVGAGTHKKVLVIGSDTMTSVLDYKDRATCVLSAMAQGGDDRGCGSERRHPRF